MSVFALPLQTDSGETPHYSFKCALEGKTYSFEFLWNDRDGAWYMQIGDAQENLLAGNMRVVLGKFFTARYRDTNLPPGQFVCQDTSGQDVDPGLEDLGGRVQVLYYDSTEV